MFRNQCADSVALHMMSHEHPSGSARKAQERYLCEEQRMVLWINPLVEKSENLRIRKRESRSCVHKWSCFSKQQRMEKGLEMQGEPRRRGSGLEEGCRMDVEEETDCKKELHEGGRLHRDIEKLTDMEPMFRESQKEKWLCQ